MLAAATFIVAAFCAGLMGFAIQRGATCTVAAMDEVIRRRKFTRLRALLEASVWVAGGLIVAAKLGWTRALPGGYPVNAWTVIGAVFLGLGAYVNRACVFGAIARLGSGQWAYLATPIGFYLGCLGVARLVETFEHQALPAKSFGHAGSGWALGLIAVFVVWQVGMPIFKLRAQRAFALRDQILTRVWTPRAATTVIGLTFLVMMLTLGAWAYTDVLAELSRGMAESLPVRTALFGCLLLGAVLGGWASGQLGKSRLQASAVLRCLIGGALMGWGSLMIPGGNDGLILVGMPLFWPYAWFAFAIMCGSIAVAMRLEDRRVRT